MSVYYGSQFDWQRQSFDRTTADTGPNTDHTTGTNAGYWLLMDSSNAPLPKVSRSRDYNVRDITSKTYYQLSITNGIDCYSPSGSSLCVADCICLAVSGLSSKDTTEFRMNDKMRVQVNYILSAYTLYKTRNKLEF